jgi:hypothetical protein
MLVWFEIYILRPKGPRAAVDIGVDGRCSIPDVGRDSSRRLVVGPWKVLLVVTAWTVSYFCLYFQAALFLSNIASEMVTEVCLYSVSLWQFSEFSSDYPTCSLHLFVYTLFSDRQLFLQFFLAVTSLSSRKWRDIEVNLRTSSCEASVVFFSDFNWTWNWSIDFSENLRCKISWKSVWLGRSYSLRTDRHEENSRTHQKHEHKL